MDIFEQLRRDEAVRRFPYRDTAGDWTIGVGRNLSSDGLADDEIETLLQNDVKYITETLSARLPWFQNLDAVRQAALVNMGFNLGFNGLERFPKFLAAMAQGDWRAAAYEMQNSAWAVQVKDRATRLEQQILTGQWQ
jgi:lysozyme